MSLPKWRLMKMPEVRLIDANALIKDIAESIRLADEWEKEAREKEDEHGIKCAIDTRRALFAMISRVKEAPTIEAEPVRRGRWINDTFCSECKRFPVDVSVSISNQELTKYFSRCPHCGARMGAIDTNVDGKGSSNND